MANVALIGDQDLKGRGRSASIASGGRSGPAPGKTLIHGPTFNGVTNEGPRLRERAGGPRLCPANE